MKKFDIPLHYRSKIITAIKEKRKSTDPRKKDFSPTILDFGSVIIKIARHFGFCYGVENAIEIAYRTIENNAGRKIYLLSEIIHNPEVNRDLTERGVEFIMDTSGRNIIPWENISSSDIVIIPAFGTTLEIEDKLKSIGIDTVTYNTTCPFVEKVWNRAEALGNSNHTIIIHGKYNHEETRATFSHSSQNSASVIVKDIEEAKLIGSILLGKLEQKKFYELFEGKYSKDFNVERDLIKIGVVNQTTMLATETQSIADYFKNVMIEKYGIENLNEHFADTKDTLCYATNDNQQATYGLLKESGDLAIVVGGYNSSNTSHIVELCSEKLPTYFISLADKIISDSEILHLDIHTKKEILTPNYLPEKSKVEILLTSGASCPDAIVDEILLKLISFFEVNKPVEEVLAEV